MAETGDTADTKKADGSGGTENTAGGQQTGSQGSQSGADNKEAIKEAKSKAFAHGYKEARDEVLKKLGVDSVESLKLKLDKIDQAEAKAQAEALAEKEEKKTLATKIQDQNKEIDELRKDSEALQILRGRSIDDQIKAAAASSGVIPGALDLMVSAAREKVSWKSDFSGLEISGKEANTKLESLADLMKEMQESHSFLFQASVKGGTGSPPSKGQQQEYKPSFGSLRDRIKHFG